MAIKPSLLLAFCLAVVCPMLVTPGITAGTEGDWPPWTLSVSNSPGASEISSNSALLNGRIISGATYEVLGAQDSEDGSAGYPSAFEYATPSDIRIYWGTVDCGSKKAKWQHVIDLGTRRTTQFSAYIAGLAANTTYYYRCQVQTSAGTFWADSSAAFTTAYSGY